MAITYDKVAAAAEELQKSGRRPSIRTVTAQMGGGSPNVVLKYLQDWQAGRPVVRVEDTALDLAITTAIASQMQRMAAEAATAADERASDLTENLDAMTAALTDAQQQLETVTAERDALELSAGKLGQQLADTKTEAERTEQHTSAQMAALRAEMAAERQHQENTAVALARAEVRLEAIPKLRADLERLQAALEAERVARANAERVAAVATAQAAAATEHATKVEATAAAAAVAAADARTAARVDAHDAAARLERVEAARDAALARAATAEQAAAVAAAMATLEHAVTQADA